MALVARTVQLEGFRNYASRAFSLDERLTVLVGPNAAGKTNVIEALEIATTGVSFRRPSWDDVIFQGRDQALIRMDVSGDGRELEIVCSFQKGSRRRVSVNGKARRSASDVAGLLPSVLFTPDDLGLVKGSAEKRRSLVDDLGSQLSPAYRSLRLEYDRAVRQRNACLREGAAEEPLAVLTEIVIHKGVELSHHRRRLFDRLQARFTELARDVAGHDVTAVYQHSWDRDGSGPETDVKEGMIRHFAARGAEERRRATTLVGPHRDDVVFFLGQREARAFGSQGQQRTIAICLKLAEVAVVTEVAGQPPLLLLDDVMSELDETRRHLLAAYMGTAAQTVVTTTNEQYFQPELLERAAVVRLP